MLRRSNHKWITRAYRRLLAGTAVLAFALNGCSNFSGRDPVRIQVKMKKYTFDPPLIRVKQGDLVELEISAADVQHGFSIPDLEIREPVPRGRSVTVRFRAEQRGQFKIKCSILCGPGHDEMQGTLIVE